MRATLLFLILLPCFCWSQSSAESSKPEPQCCQCSTHSEDDGSVSVLCLSEKQMHSHVVHVVPLKLGEPHAKASGTLVLRVMFQPDGTVGCVKGVSGYPLALASAMEVVPKWTFRPIQKKDKKYGGCGLVRVKYRLIDSEEREENQRQRAPPAGIPKAAPRCSVEHHSPAVQLT